MNKIKSKVSLSVNRIVVAMIAVSIGFSVMPGFVTKAYSNGGAAFLGGMVASHIIGNAERRSERRTEAEEYQAYDQPSRVQQAAPAAAPAPAAKQTTQQRLDQLDKLASGGYITPKEYKAKKKAIMDGM